MLKINKFTQEPAEVTAWKALANDDWQPSYGNLMGLERRAMRQALLTEQGHVCCYCNRRIMESPSVDNIAEFHIEHFRPQHAFEHLELEYQNLHASCFKNDNPNGRRHCGPAKGDWFDEELTLSPLNDHRDRLRYGHNGEVLESTDSAVTAMVKKLNLNDKMLVSEREAQIAGILSADLMRQATQEELVYLYQAYQQLQEGCYKPFAAAVQQRIADFFAPHIRTQL